MGLDARMSGVRESLYIVLLARGALKVNKGATGIILASGHQLTYDRNLTLSADDPIAAGRTDGRLSWTHNLTNGGSRFSLTTGPDKSDPCAKLLLRISPPADNELRGVAPYESALLMTNDMADGRCRTFAPLEGERDDNSCAGFFHITHYLAGYIVGEMTSRSPIQAATVQEVVDGPLDKS